MKKFIIEISSFVAIGLFFTWVLKLITADGWSQGWWAAILTLTITGMLFPENETR